MAFAFTWIIENYTPRLHEVTKKLESPSFYFNRSKWFLTLEPETFFYEIINSDDFSISCRLQRYEDGEPYDVVTINFKIEIIEPNESVLHSQTFENKMFAKGSIRSWLNCLKNTDVLRILTSNQDYLTIRCFLSETKFPASMVVSNYYAVKNVICTNSHSFPWIVQYEDTPEWSKSRIFYMLEQSPLKISIRILNDDVFIEIRKINAWTLQTQIIYFSLHWLDVNGKTVEQENQSYLATNDWNNVWKFQSRITNACMKNVLLNSPNNTFRLILNLMVSNGVIMKVESQKVYYSLPSPFSYQTIPNIQSYTDLSQSMKDIRVNKQNCDVKFQVDGRCFLAHKSILKTREPYLLEERESEDFFITISVPDSDPKTVERFLVYLYTGTLNGVSFEDVLKLVVLADSLECYHLVYAFLPFLRDNLTVENVIKTLLILLIATKIKYLSLKKIIYNFIKVHEEEIFALPECLELIKNDDPISRNVLRFINDIKTI